MIQIAEAIYNANYNDAYNQFTGYRQLLNFNPLSDGGSRRRAKRFSVEGLLSGSVRQGL